MCEISVCLLRLSLKQRWWEVVFIAGEKRLRWRGFGDWWFRPAAGFGR